MPEPLSPVPPQRVGWIDQARGVALIAMIVFHFSFDLRLLGLVSWPVGSHPLWRMFAIAIAGSFVALAGMSLQLAAAGGLEVRPFLRRLGLIAGAAALVTLGTWVAMPVPVVFGILHAIAVFSVLALPFLRAPTWAVLTTAGLVMIAPAVLTSEAFAHPLLYPLGLDPDPRPSFDYEPILPWFAPMLLGLALARILPATRGPVVNDLLAILGRNSLTVYLLHQPILYGTLFGLIRLGLV